MSDKNAPLGLLRELSITGIPGSPLTSIHTIIMGPGGEYFLSDRFNHRVIALNSQGEFMFVIGCRGDKHGQFWYPSGIAVVKNGASSELIVCDMWNHRIQRFDLDGSFISSFGSVGDSEEHFNEPVSVIEDDDGGIWILDRSNNRVKKHSLDGAVISSFGKRLGVDEERKQNDPAEVLLGGAPLDHGYLYPESFARQSDGTFIIADSGNHRLCHVTRDGVALDFIPLHLEKNGSNFYPQLVTVISDGLALVGGLSSCWIININRPWIIEELELGNGPRSSVAITSISTESGAQGAIVADINRAVISHYEFSGELLSKDSAPGALPSESELKEIPNKWTRSGRKMWSVFIKVAPETNENIERVRKYIEAGKASASFTASKLSNIEGELCKALVRYREATEKMEAAKRSGGLEKDTKSALTLESLQCALLQKERVSLRWELISDIDALVGVVSGAWERDRLGDEVEGLIKIIREEYDDRKKDFIEVAQWLFQHLQKPETIHQHAIVHAFAASLFLIDQINYLQKTLVLLQGESYQPESLDHKATLDSALSHYRKGLLRGLASDSLFITCLVCNAWDYSETVKAVYLSIIDGKSGQLKTENAVKLHDLVERSGSVSEHLVNILASLAGAPQSTLLAEELAARLQMWGRLDTAQGLIDRYKPSSKLEDMPVRWANLIKRQDILTSGPAPIILKNGQSVVEASGGKANDIDLRYIESVTFTNPYDNTPLTPSLFCVVSTTSLLIYDDTVEGLFLCDLEEGVRPLLARPASVKGMTMTPTGDLLYTRRVMENPVEDRLTLLNLSTGDVADLIIEAEGAFPKSPFQPVLCSPSEYLISDYYGQKVWLVNSNFGSGQMIFTTPSSPYFIGFGKGRIAVPYALDNSVYLYNRTEGRGEFINDDYLVNPMACHIDDSGLIYITTGAGLQIYGMDGGMKLGVSGLQDGHSRYSLDHHHYCIAGSTSFTKGDLLISGIRNCKIHIFQTGARN